MGVKPVPSLFFGAVCCCGPCLTVFGFETATVHMTVFASGFAIFLASATTLPAVPSINSSAAYFVSLSTRSILSRIAVSAFCMSYNALLFILLFSKFLSPLN